MQLTIFILIILLIFLLFLKLIIKYPKLLFLIIGLIIISFCFYKYKNEIKIIKDTKRIVSLEVPSNTFYYSIKINDKEKLITILEDINNISNIIKGSYNSYKFEKEYNTNLELSIINENSIIQSTFYIKDNKLINGDRCIIFDYNLENYLNKIYNNY